MSSTVGFFIGLPYAKLSGIVLATLSNAARVHEIPLSDGVKYEVEQKLPGGQTLDCGVFEVTRIALIPKRLLPILDLDLVDDGALTSWTELRILCHDGMGKASLNKQQEMLGRLLETLPSYVSILKDEPLSQQASGSDLEKIRHIIRHGEPLDEIDDTQRSRVTSRRKKTGRPLLLEDEYWRDRVRDVLKEIEEIRAKDSNRTYESIYLQLGNKYKMAARTIREWRAKYGDLDELN